MQGKLFCYSEKTQLLRIIFPKSYNFCGLYSLKVVFFIALEFCVFDSFKNSMIYFF